MFLAVTEKHESRSYSDWNFSLVQETRAYLERKKPSENFIRAFFARFCNRMPTPPKNCLNMEHSPLTRYIYLNIWVSPVGNS